MEEKARKEQGRAGRRGGRQTEDMEWLIVYLVSFSSETESSYGSYISGMFNSIKGNKIKERRK